MTDMLAAASIHTDGMSEGATTLIRASIAPNTLRVYRGALDRLSEWLDGRSLTDRLLAEYLTELFEAGKSPVVLQQVISAIRWRTGGPVGEAAHRVMAGARRAGRDRGRGQVKGVTWEMVDAICDQCLASETSAGHRDAALIRTMSDGLLRVSEVVALDVADLVDHNIFIKSSKTDQTGEGVYLFIHEETRHMLHTWLTTAKIEDGPIFRPISRYGYVRNTRLTADSARQIIKARSSEAGFTGFISGHSLRVGSAQELSERGSTREGLQRAGRWKSANQPAHYTRGIETQRSDMAMLRNIDK